MRVGTGWPLGDPCRGPGAAASPGAQAVEPGSGGTAGRWTGLAEGGM